MEKDAGEKKICMVEFLSVVAWCANWGGNREGDEREEKVAAALI
jgi:hypothetical protein